MASRGIRNNNPGNIEYGPFARSYGATGSDGRFAIFPDAQSGIGAIYGLQNRYENSGRESVRERISRWAPAGENNVNAYVNAVSGAMGVDPDTKFSINDSLMGPAFVSAMIQHENGSQPYTLDDLAAAQGPGVAGRSNRPQPNLGIIEGGTGSVEQALASLGMEPDQAFAVADSGQPPLSSYATGQSDVFTNIFGPGNNAPTPHVLHPPTPTPATAYPSQDESNRLIESYMETERGKAYSAMPAQALSPPAPIPSPASGQPDIEAMKAQIQETAKKMIAEGAPPGPILKQLSDAGIGPPIPSTPDNTPLTAAQAEENLRQQYPAPSYPGEAERERDRALGLGALQPDMHLAGDATGNNVPIPFGSSEGQAPQVGAQLSGDSQGYSNGASGSADGQIHQSFFPGKATDDQLRASISDPSMSWGGNPTPDAPANRPTPTMEAVAGSMSALPSGGSGSANGDWHQSYFPGKAADDSLVPSVSDPSMMGGSNPTYDTPANRPVPTMEKLGGSMTSWSMPDPNVNADRPIPTPSPSLTGDATAGADNSSASAEAKATGPWSSPTPDYTSTPRPVPTTSIMGPAGGQDRTMQVGTGVPEQEMTAGGLQRIAADAPTLQSTWNAPAPAPPTPSPSIFDTMTGTDAHIGKLEDDAFVGAPVSAPTPIPTPAPMPTSRVPQSRPAYAAPAPVAPAPAPVPRTVQRVAKPPEDAGGWMGSIKKAADAAASAVKQGAMKTWLGSGPVQRATMGIDGTPAAIGSTGFWNNLDTSSPTATAQASFAAGNRARAQSGLYSLAQAVAMMSGGPGGSYASNYSSRIDPRSSSYNRGTALTDRTSNQ